MNVSKCIRRGLLSFQILQPPQLKSRVVADFSRLLLLQGPRGFCVNLSYGWNCTSIRVGKESRTHSIVLPIEAQPNVTSRTRCASSEAGGAGPQAMEGKARQLIMYSKPGCCLCDGLKEKLSTLPNVELEIRNILTNPVWENMYQYEIPVLAYIREDGTEEAIPRLSPRLSAEQMHKKLEAVMG